jgi:hypothetical protein
MIREAACVLREAGHTELADQIEWVVSEAEGWEG